MTYVVPGMTLIPQQLNMACWYASARMVLTWRQNRTQSCEGDLVPPELDAQCRALRDANNGITNPGLIAMAKRLGLRAVPPMSPLPELVGQWLRSYGPLWVNGTSHITVIAGIRSGMGGKAEVLVYDPWPVNTGKIEWRGYETWYINDPVAGRDTSASVQTIFLHCPPL